MKKEKSNYLILIILGLLLMLLPVGFNNMFGSSTDWVSQHTVFPEYFRNMFYTTGELIPDLAMNIGAGQNIFNFSYYGLLNPIILVSYFLPFIKMVDYMVISSIVVVISSALLLYKWLRNNKHSNFNSLISSIIFLCSAPLMFHVHRHIMFINYMPFLILGLMGIDKYFKQNKSWLLILSIFLIIMTSYYYSVGSLLVLVIYGMSKYLEKNDFNFKDFVLNMLKLAIPFVIGILLAGVLLIPTFYALINSGDNTSLSVKMMELLPKIDINMILYDPYCLGLSAISILAILNGLFTKNKKFLSVVLIIVVTFPVITYILNGMLYIRPKVLIPFLPLVILMISRLLKKLDDKAINTFFLIAVFVLLTNFSYLFLIDAAILLVSLLFYKKYQKKYIYIVPALIMAILLAVQTGYSVDYISKKKYNRYFNNEINSYVDKVIQNDSSYYRMNNLINASTTLNKVYNAKYYQTSVYSSIDNYLYRYFYFYTFKNNMGNRNNIILTQNNNILIKNFLGVKYVISDKEVPGYTKIGEKTYENDLVLPLGYASNRLSSIDSLEYPYVVESLLNSIVIDNKSKIESKIKKEDLFTLDKEYMFEEKTFVDRKLSRTLKKEVLFVSFDMNYNQTCEEGDTYIVINGVGNKLSCQDHIYHNKNFTFNYIIYDNEISSLKIEFSKGKFDLSNLKVYTIPYEEITSFGGTIDKFEISSIKDNVIKGKINVSNNGYFASSIPFDKGYKVFVDGKEREPEIINKAFLGFQIEKGNHNIKIVYETPYLKLGKTVSTIGLSMFILSIVFENKKIVKNKQI